MKTGDFVRAEELVQYVHSVLADQELDAAIEAVGEVDAVFPHDALAQHTAGLVWERTYIEQTAEGRDPDLTMYERAEHHYRRALELDPDRAELHGERLLAALFLLGSQKEDVQRLRDVIALALRLAALGDPTRRGDRLRDGAAAATALARITQGLNDWRTAAQLYEEASAPPGGGRDAFFFHYYRGMARRVVAQSGSDQEGLREAAASLAQALAIKTSRAVEYLLADCLVMLEDPAEGERRLMDELVARLSAASPADKLIAALHKRWKLRCQMIDTAHSQDVEPGT